MDFAFNLWCVGFSWISGTGVLKSASRPGHTAGSFTVIAEKHMLARTDLWSLEQYAERRNTFREQVLAHKRNRQLLIGELIFLILNLIKQKLLLLVNFLIVILIKKIG